MPGPRRDLPTTATMLKGYLGNSYDIFGLIGAATTGIVAFKVALGIFRFLTAHFLSKALGLSANVKKAGSWAVVTGCTDGIGKAYAEQLAARGLNVVLISRTMSKLEDMAKEVESKYKVETKVIAVDFSEEGIYDNIRVKLEGLDIGVLVNNVGISYDHPEYFHQVDAPNFALSMIHMNCSSVAKMTEIVLPGMIKKRCGYVINIGSSAGTWPTAFLALYSGTKAFVDLFTRSLQDEYSGMGITFQCVAPYFVVSKLSKFRKATMFVPNPTTFVKNALTTLGVQHRTTGYWAHEIQDLYMGFIPTYVTKSFLMKARTRALQKKKTASKGE